MIDLETEVILAAQIYPGDAGGRQTIVESKPLAGERRPAPRAWHSPKRWWPTRAITRRRRWRRVRRWGCGRTSPSATCGRRRWHDKPARGSSRFGNRRRVRGARSRLQRRRSERVGTELRAHLRQRETTAHLAARTRERPEALPAHGRRAQSRPHHAHAVRDRHAAEPPGARGSGIRRRLCRPSSRPSPCDRFQSFLRRQSHPLRHCRDEPNPHRARHAISAFFNGLLAR